MVRPSRWIWVGVVILIAPVPFVPTENGRWQCGLCGKHERRKLIAGLTYSTTRIPSPYHDWFMGTVNRPHDHDWVFVGCHERGGLLWGMIACSMMRMSLLEEIPKLANQNLSVKAVDVLFSFSESQRRQEFRDFDGVCRLPNDPAYAQWWRGHPRWQEVFPPPEPNSVGFATLGLAS
jgi:hypothetical protein